MRPAQIFLNLLLITGILLFFPTNITPQTSDWTAVKVLQPGTDVMVLRKNGGRIVGYVQGSTDDTIAITSDSGSFVVGRDNVKKIYYAVPRDKRKSMNRGALIG